MKSYYTLFSCLFGSSLYGTRTPTSDLDVKRIVAYSIGDLLVGKPLKNEVHKTNNARNVRNGVDDIDEELVPIQVFARDFLAGQTYALEFAFSIDGTHAQQTFANNKHDADFFRQFVKELKEKFLTSNIKAMMGYVINQANIYSLKGERLNMLNEFQKILNSNDIYFLRSKSLMQIYFDAVHIPCLVFASDLLALEAKYPKYFKITEYDIGAGMMRPCFVVNDKTFPLTNTLEHSRQMLQSMISKYGTRAEEARGSNVDWKAMMHALRIVDEGIMLLSEHKLSFPFSQEKVNYYLDVKQGKVDIELVREELSEKLNKLKGLEQTTKLPTSKELQDEFDQWLEDKMIDFYDIDLASKV